MAKQWQSAGEGQQRMKVQCRERGSLVCHARCSEGGGPVAQVDGLLGHRVPKHHCYPAQCQ